MFTSPYCAHRHSTVSEGRECWQRLRATLVKPEPVVLMVTQPQLDFIEKLGGDLTYAAKLTRRNASEYIDRLKKERPVQEKAPQSRIPIGMLQELRKGHFATRMDESHAWTFFRVSRPKSGRFAGAIKVQTQHGDEYRPMLTVWPNGQASVHNQSVEQQLILAIVNPNDAGYEYAQRLGRCMICGKSLTDDRSRWYGIGPDCETRHEHIIDLVNERKGVYQPGLGH